MERLIIDIFAIIFFSTSSFTIILLIISAIYYHLWNLKDIDCTSSKTIKESYRKAEKYEYKSNKFLSISIKSVLIMFIEGVIILIFI